jgi:subtilisin family serine protease
MRHVNFGQKGDPGFDLKESPDLIAVRTRSRQPVMGSGPVPQATAREVADGNLVASFPEAGVEVYRVPTAARTLDERKRSLRAAPDVRFAGSVLVHPVTNEPVLYTENIYIRFREDLDPEQCEAIIHDAGLTVKETLDFATNAYFVEAPEGTGQRVFDIANELLKRDDVVHCHPELIQRREHKEIFPQQWHLKQTTINNIPVSAHANVDAAHALARGAGVTIAIIDDGVDVEHVEFRGVAKIVASRDVTFATNDARPKSASDRHGTPCAGVACANGHDGACGVAPQAALMPIRLMSPLGSIREAQAFRWAADNGADVISCSWGPPDGRWWDPNDPAHNAAWPLPASTRDAIDYAVTNGRQGKGCIVLFAAGNGNESVDLDGYASYERVIAVAACNDRGKRSFYSDFGKAVWCAFPSNDVSSAQPLTPGIWTTDRTGALGYNPGNVQSGDAAGNYTNSFGGTSSACPGAAGVVALVLSANPRLRWNEVRDILRRACDRIDPQGGQYSAEGHSRFYGYGRLNAATAVKLAGAEVAPLITVNKVVMAPIPDLGTAAATLTVSETVPIAKLSVQIRIDHTYIGDLVVTLIPPPGKGLPNTVLHNRAGGSRNRIDRVYDPSTTPGLAAYSGKACDGTWTVQVQDRALADSGTLRQVGLQLTPAAPGAAPRAELSIAVTPVAAKKAQAKPRRAKKRARTAVAA